MSRSIVRRSGGECPRIHGLPPDERRIAADEAARLRGAIATLPEEQRRALVLAAFFGRTAREIGMLEHVPLGTAKTRIRAAMLKLHSLLEVRDG